jgi:hypothetical protein
LITVVGPTGFIPTNERNPMDYLTNLPAHMAGLELDAAGRPVPKFVQWIDGKPDFRIMNPMHMRACIMRDVCWQCGEKLGRYKTFVIGPMCMVNKISAEPPSHLDCAVYAATHCPFLINPDKVRRDANMPKGQVEPAGIMIERNPGVEALYTTRTYKAFAEGRGVLFAMGDPEHVEWYAEGRPATQAEVLASIESGTAALYEADRGFPNEAEAHRQLDSLVKGITMWVRETVPA